MSASFDDLANWTTQLRKGLLELCILNLLGDGELYGYDLVKKLTAVPGMLITEGTVYPLLTRLKGAALVETRLEESSSGPARKYYRLTAEGQRLRHLMNLYWKDVASGVNQLLEEARHG